MDKDADDYELKVNEYMLKLVPYFNSSLGSLFKVRHWDITSVTAARKYLCWMESLNKRSAKEVIAGRKSKLDLENEGKGTVYRLKKEDQLTESTLQMHGNVAEALKESTANQSKIVTLLERSLLSTPSIAGSAAPTVDSEKRLALMESQLGQFNARLDVMMASNAETNQLIRQVLLNNQPK